MKSKPCQALRPLFLTTFAACSVAALSGCATAPRPVSILVPSILQAPCEGYSGPMATVGDLATFALQQEAAVQSCEAKRRGLSELIAATNEATRPRSWLDRLRRKR